jgi:hypothetical protein
MYDFYANPPQTKYDVKAWLTSWLEPTSSASAFECNGESFIQTHGFRRAFHMHSVFRSLSTNECIWWVEPDEHINSYDRFPSTVRYSDFDALIEQVANNYCAQWNLPV